MFGNYSYDVTTSTGTSPISYTYFTTGATVTATTSGTVVELYLMLGLLM
ncbi:hypothetical protein [Antarcticibacterium arcticum]|nr:hypothetical protein [Antarcticibacterium arcticum]